MSRGQIRREQQKVLKRKACRGTEEEIITERGGGWRAVVQRKEPLRQLNKTREHRHCKCLDIGGDESEGELHWGKL